MDGETETNPFGDVMPKDGAPDTGAGDAGGEGGEGGDKGDKGEKGKEGGDKDHTATIAELSKKVGELEALHGTKDENIAAMRDLLKKYEKGEIKPKGGEEGKKEAEVLFKEIKFSKDLPKEKLEEMTDTEIALHDNVATLQDGMNKLFAQLQSQGSKVDETKETNVSETVREEALALAGDDKKVANEIIEAFNLIDKDVRKGADKAKLKELVAMANKMRPDYKPPKENETKRGAPVKKGGEGADPFGNAKIVDEARKGSNGSYDL